MEKILRLLKIYIPRSFFTAMQPYYHYVLAGIGAVYYGFPSRKLYVVGVTGTKGKTTVTELVAALLEEAGHRVALSNSSRFKIAGTSEKNLIGRTMPGRTRLQHFLWRAVRANCGYAVIEMSSEGAKQFRHAFIDLDALIFINLSPEHIEAHGSYENYVTAKVSLAQALERGNASAHTIIANSDDKESQKFLSVSAGRKLTFKISDAGDYFTSSRGSDIVWRGHAIHLQLPGKFNVYNALAAATFAESRDIDAYTVKKALEKFVLVPGRMESINEGQNFTVIVDYAHTIDSLNSAYAVYEGIEKICVLGGTGGGRDVAKRSIMGEVADRHCSHIILTTEDPYDESPEDIAKDVASGIQRCTHEFISDRREAIRKAFALAKPGSVVFITGKGADPYIMGPNGSRLPWSDAEVAREELSKLKNKQMA